MTKMFIKKNDVLITGPFAGEFGWELMGWQGYVRKLSSKYKRTISISYSSSKYLYENCLFFGHNLKLVGSKFGYGEIDKGNCDMLLSAAKRNFGVEACDVFQPTDLNKINRFLIGKQKFIQFYEKPLSKTAIDLVFHFRNFSRTDLDHKNLAKERADAVVAYFSSRGFTCACIGHPELSYCPPQALDFRSLELKQTVSVISNSHMVIGGSSGPMHLACLCGKPVVTWIGPPADIERYRSYWNPFKVKTYIVSEETFNPDAELIIQTVSRAIESQRS
jgi:hypothetical protein